MAKELGINKITFDKKLRDTNLGIYHGGLKKDFYRDFPIYSESRFYKRPKEGESWQDTQKRIMDFLKEIEKKYQGKKILIVSHGEPLWLMEGIVKNWSRRELLKMRKFNFIKTDELRQI